MIEVAESPYGSIIAGRVIKLKNGTGKAEGKLTIVKIAEITGDGRPASRKVTMLCWNSSKHGSRFLADRAAALKPGDAVSARIEWDKGDLNKCTAFEIKKSGIYSLTADQNKKDIIICGTVCRTSIENDGSFTAFMAVKQKRNPGFETAWYRAVFRNHKPGHEKPVSNGEMLLIRCDRIKEVTFMNYHWKETVVYKFKKIPMINDYQRV